LVSKIPEHTYAPFAPLCSKCFIYSSSISISTGFILLTTMCIGYIHQLSNKTLFLHKTILGGIPPPLQVTPMCTSNPAVRCSIFHKNIAATFPALTLLLPPTANLNSHHYCTCISSSYSFTHDSRRHGMYAQLSTLIK
jgi:hypothetical protein